MHKSRMTAWVVYRCARDSRRTLVVIAKRLAPLELEVDVVNEGAHGLLWRERAARGRLVDGRDAIGEINLVRNRGRRFEAVARHEIEEHTKLRVLLEISLVRA